MKLYTPKIVKAMEIALEAHNGQLDKAGKPYISHVMRVADKMKTEEEIIVALLHDVIEDAGSNYSRIINEKFGYPIWYSVLSLTHSKDESYESYIHKIQKTDIPKAVKIADLEDNMDAERTLETISYLLEKGNDGAVMKMLKKRDKYVKAYNKLKKLY